MPRDLNGSSHYLDGGDITALNSLGELSWHQWIWIDADEAGLTDMVFWSKCDASFLNI